MSFRRRRNRAASRGFTLIELLIAMIVGGVILTALATLMARVVAANWAAETHVRAVQSLGTLGRHFRNDVHRATAVHVEPTGPPSLLLTMEDGSHIRYEATASGTTRAQRTADDKAQQHEVYALAPFKVLGFDSTDSSGEVSVRLVRAIDHPNQRVVGARFSITALAPHASREPRPEVSP